jgi:hypothetical protein
LTFHQAASLAHSSALETVSAIGDITKLYVDKYGVPPVGKRVFIHTRQQVNGLRDAAKQITAVVPRG